MIPGMTQATRDLADGNQMPLRGLGVWQVPDGPECVGAVRWALELGFRHIDTAQAYRNEASCQRHGVALEAYSPLGTGHLLSHPIVGAIAAQASRTPAQVLLRWCLQRGVPALCKSTHRDRTAENSRSFDFELTGEELAQLDVLDRTGRTGNALERTWW